jgi:hypothetical protein
MTPSMESWAPTMIFRMGPVLGLRRCFRKGSQRRLAGFARIFKRGRAEGICAMNAPFDE